ncbi:hypothetical protein ABSA28_00844 [Candidatus Hepatincolaceae symbiont of Richtersius coronifer]
MKLKKSRQYYEKKRKYEVLDEVVYNYYVESFGFLEQVLLATLCLYTQGVYWGVGSIIHLTEVEVKAQTREKLVEQMNIDVLINGIKKETLNNKISTFRIVDNIGNNLDELNSTINNADFNFEIPKNKAK